MENFFCWNASYSKEYLSQSKLKWPYIPSNLSFPEKIKKIYSQRMGIEAMFKDYKTGGYNSCISESQWNEIE